MGLFSDRHRNLSLRSAYRSPSITGDSGVRSPSTREINSHDLDWTSTKVTHKGFSAGPPTSCRLISTLTHRTHPVQTSNLVESAVLSQRLQPLRPLQA